MRLAPVLVIAVLAAGCGGEGGGTTTTAATTTAPPVTTTPADPGKAAIEAFVAAARAGRAEAMWDLLSTATRERAGPTLSDFRNGSATEISEGVGSFDRFTVILSERVTPEFGVVAIDGPRVAEGTPERAVYATALRLEGTSWKIELGGSVVVRPIGPDPGAHETLVAQVAAAVEGPGGAGTAVMYLDGQSVPNPQVRSTGANSTLFANFEPALDRGRHTVVVFATDGREAAATAWDFTAAKG